MLPEPVAVAFANTRSSSGRDRIATLAAWRAWLRAWPGLRLVGHAIDMQGLLALGVIRDDVQLVLRGAAGGDGRASTAGTRLLELVNAPSSLALRWRAGRPVLAVGRRAGPVAAIGQQLAHAALDLLLTGPPLAICDGRGCLKLFIASRPDRRWCDSAVCGNRARVHAHGQRARRATAAPAGRKE